MSSTTITVDSTAGFANAGVVVDASGDVFRYTGKTEPIDVMNERINKKHDRIEERLSKMKVKVEVDKKTREYNLNTSLRNYIDPRIYKNWSEKVELDWNKLYPKTLQRKFQWVEQTE